MRLACVFLLCVLCACSAQSAELPQEVPLTEWRDDLRVLARELPKRHANAFHSISRVAFDSVVRAVEAGLDSTTTTSDAAFVGLMSIAAAVGDLHTGVRLPPNWQRFSIVPEWFGCLEGSTGQCQLRIVAAAPGYETTLGTQIVAIDSVPVEEVHRRMRSVIPKAESDGAVWSFSARHVQYPNLLHGLRVIREVKSSSFTLRDSAGATFTIRPRLMPRSAAIREWPSAQLSTPISRSRLHESVWWTLLADSQTVYFAWDGYPDKSELRRLSDGLLEYVATTGATRLIIDMRRNPGGDFTKGREILIPTLQRSPNLMIRGNLFVLIGPGTYSAAMTNAVDLRIRMNAILVGLPTGSRPNGYQEGREFTLPRTKVTVGYSTKYYRFQERDTPGVIPDHRIEQSWQDFRAGRDPALDWILFRKGGGSG